jgi:cysteine desulfuration protein SufE
VNFGERQQAITIELSGIKNSQDRFAQIVKRGRCHPGLPPDLKTDAHRLSGCLAKLWLICEFSNGLCHYRADSDSAIVKGIAVMLCDLFSGLPPSEILSHDPSFLKAVGIDQHLTSNRRDSLGRIFEKMRAFAQAHQ